MRSPVVNIGMISLFVGLMALTVPAPAMAPGFVLLDRIQKGSWQLKSVDGGAPRRICVRNGEELLTFHHRQRSCSRYVVKNAAGELTVHMTCGAAGHVRTTLRYETPRLVQIYTQGLDEGSPFSDSFEARRMGSCD